MSAAFVHNQNVDVAIMVDSPGHVFSEGTEPLLCRGGYLDCLTLCSLSPGDANG